jgi:hypothetical protein
MQGSLLQRQQRSLSQKSACCPCASSLSKTASRRVPFKPYNSMNESQAAVALVEEELREQALSQQQHTLQSRFRVVPQQYHKVRFQATKYAGSKSWSLSAQAWRGGHAASGRFLTPKVLHAFHWCCFCRCCISYGMGRAFTMVSSRTPM